MIARRLSSELARVGAARGYANFFARVTHDELNLLHIHIQFGNVGYGCRVSKLAICDSDLAQVAGVLLDEAAAKIAEHGAVGPEVDWYTKALVEHVKDAPVTTVFALPRGSRKDCALAALLKQEDES